MLVVSYQWLKFVCQLDAAIFRQYMCSAYTDLVVCKSIGSLCVRYLHYIKASALKRNDAENRKFSTFQSMPAIAEMNLYLLNRQYCSKRNQINSIQLFENDSHFAEINANAYTRISENGLTLFRVCNRSHFFDERSIQIQ